MIFPIGQGGYAVYEGASSRQSRYAYCVDVSDAPLNTAGDAIGASAAEVDVVVHF